MEDSSKDQANLPNVNESSLDPSVTTQPDHRPNPDTVESLELISEPKKILYQCETCSRTFSTISSRNFHMKKCFGQAISIDQELMEDSSKDSNKRPNPDTVEPLEENRKPKKGLNAILVALQFEENIAKKQHMIKYHGDLIEDSSMDQTNLPDVNESPLGPSANTEPSTATTEPFWPLQILLRQLQNLLRPIQNLLRPIQILLLLQTTKK